MWTRLLNLTIANISAYDYTTYKCVAMNALGRDNKYMSVGKCASTDSISNGSYCTSAEYSNSNEGVTPILRMQATFCHTRLVPYLKLNPSSQFSTKKLHKLTSFDLMNALHFQKTTDVVRG